MIQVDFRSRSRIKNPTLSMLRNPTPPKILRLLLRNPGYRHKLLLYVRPLSMFSDTSAVNVAYRW